MSSNCSPAPAPFGINRRQFLQTSAAATALAALPSLGADALDLVHGKPRRVGLIGCGCYGKSDLWRLIQVAPVEVVALCDPDQNMLREAIYIASQRQKSKQRPPTYHDYRQMLKEQPCDIVVIGSPDHWHAFHCIAAIEAGADFYCQNPSAAMCARARPCWMPRASTSAWSRSGPNAKAPRT